MSDLESRGFTVIRNDDQQFIVTHLDADGKPDFMTALAKTLEEAQEIEGTVMFLEGNDGADKLVACAVSRIKCSREALQRLFVALNIMDGPDSQHGADLFFALPEDVNAQGFQSESGMTLSPRLTGDPEAWRGLTEDITPLIRAVLLEGKEEAVDKIAAITTAFRAAEDETWGFAEDGE